MKRFGLAVLLVVVLLVGVGAGWWFGQQSLLQTSLAHELEVTGLCANGLKLAKSNDPDRLVALLEQRLDSAVIHASRLVDDGVRLDLPTPNLLEGTRRAADYYREAGSDEDSSRIDSLLAELDSAR